MDNEKARQIGFETGRKIALRIRVAKENQDNMECEHNPKAICEYCIREASTVYERNHRDSKIDALGAYREGLNEGISKGIAERLEKRRNSKKLQGRLARLIPNGIPRWIRVYDNGGESIDRYTVVFTKKIPGYSKFWYPYLAMSSFPYHPQGFGQHGESQYKTIDVNKWGFSPALGKKNHLGTRIKFEDLPEDCQKLTINDYRYYWNLE
ncbi:MAG TPA: hypothetical protein PLP33_24510 [Leptospiraceae bacterium]|nr:hypothetical protein [Leptospiraceae bacterium]